MNRYIIKENVHIAKQQGKGAQPYFSLGKYKLKP
jgi:hypothetical protein